MIVLLKGLDLATSPTCISRSVILHFQTGATDLILCCRFWQTSQDIALTTVVTSLLGRRRSVHDYNENCASHLDISKYILSYHTFKLEPQGSEKQVEYHQLRNGRS